MRNFLKNIFVAKFILANLIIPAVLLVLYCISFAYVLSLFSLKGVNYYFTIKFGKYLTYALGVTIPFFLLLYRLQVSGKVSIKQVVEKISFGDLFLLMVPLTPVVRYILSNQGILSLTESLYVLIFVALFGCLYFFLIPVLLGDFIQVRVPLMLGLAFVYTIVSMPMMSNYFSWYEIGALRKQLMMFGGVFLLIWLLYHLGGRKNLYLFVTLYFVLNGAVNLWSLKSKVEMSSLTFDDNKLLQLVDGEKPVSTPNVYLLVYDAYVPNETIISYGLDNSVQESYLTSRGFTLYPRTYSVGSSSLSTMSRVLNASTEYYGTARRGVSGDGVVQEIFHQIGYETYGVFPYDFMFRGIGASYDFAIPKEVISADRLLLRGIFLGEFRFDIERLDFTHQTNEEFIRAKRNVFASLGRKPSFLYIHTTFPGHSQNSGVCLPDEVDRFGDRLTQANVEMQEDVNLLLANDPGAIIIIAGDHGPYLTKNCYLITDELESGEINRLDIQDRYGTFLAIRWPTGNFDQYDDITVLQDLFPAVFAYIYKDEGLLMAKIPSFTIDSAISSVSVSNGYIVGGMNDGESLFLSENNP